MKNFKKIFFYMIIIFIIILAVIILKRINTHNLRNILGINQELYVRGNSEIFNDILNFKYTISNKELTVPGGIGADDIAEYYDKDGNFLFSITIYNNIAYINKANSDKRIELYCDRTKKVDNYNANIILPNPEHGLLEKITYDLMNQFKNDNSINSWTYEQIYEKNSISKEIRYTNKEKEEWAKYNFKIDIKIKEFKNTEGMNHRFEFLSKYLKVGNENKIIKVEDEVIYEELSDSNYYDILIKKDNIIVEIKEQKQIENDIEKFESVKKIFEKYGFSY